MWLGKIILMQLSINMPLLILLSSAVGGDVPSKRNVIGYNNFASWIIVDMSSIMLVTLQKHNSCARVLFYIILCYILFYFVGNGQAALLCCEGTLVSHCYWTVGVFTVTVTAYNHVDSENASLTVTVQDIIHSQFFVAFIHFFSSVFSSAGWAIHISWSKCCLCVSVSGWPTNCNRCSQRLVILHAQTY